MKKSINTVVILDQASGYLQIDMLEAYALKYQKRVIIAGTIVERGTPLSKDVTWHKIEKYDRSTKFKRIYTWLKASLQMFFLVAFKYRKAHIVAITNPPFSIFVPWVLVCSYDIVVYDMYPDALVQYGYFKKNNLIYRLWFYLNKNVMSKSRKIITLTNGMKELVNQYVSRNKDVDVIPLWSDVSDFNIISREENVILKQCNSLNKFVIVYSGNLGQTHPVEKLVELANLLDRNIFSVIIIGDGSKKNKLEKIIEKQKLPHVYLLPWQPIELLSHNLCAGHLNVVTLDEIAGNLSIPSKTFNILSIGNPVIGICSEDSDLAKLIIENNCGLVSKPSSISLLAEKITLLAEDELEYNRLKLNSLVASKKFTKENAKAYL